MHVIPISAFTDNYIWAIVDRQTNCFDCVDPGEAGPVLQFANTQHLQLRSILLTHHHHDHIGGVGQLVQAYPACQVYGPNDSRIPHITQQVTANQTINPGAHTFHILFNPGHTSSHISYYEAQAGWLFCGDTLFSAGCGRVFDGTLSELYQSMQLFKSLPPATKIFCAHEYTMQNLHFALSVEPHNQAIHNQLHQLKTQASTCSLPSTLALELLINPFLRTEQATVQAFAQHHGAVSNEPLEIFRILREAKNNFK